MKALWTSDALLAITGGKSSGPLPENIFGISIDTRTLQPGDMFIALRGNRMDGHDFIEKAVSAGVSLCLVEESRLALLPSGIPLIVVPDTLSALEKIGIAARVRTRARVIAVTGSVGKTSTKEAISHVLACFGSVHASPKSFNNHWGVPLTLARMPEDLDYAVVEAGMNHAGEIRSLARMIRPHIVLITLVGPVHIGYFENIEDIVRAKAEIFEYLEPGGSVVLNSDDSNTAILGRIAESLGIVNIFGFGSHPDATWQLLDQKIDMCGGRFSVKFGQEIFSVHVGARGAHMIYNALAALAVVSLVGISFSSASNALATFSSLEGRGRVLQLMHSSGSFTLLDESYSANPLSMRSAIDLLSLFRDCRRIAVLGDMSELGEHASYFHQELLAYLANSSIEHVFLTGSKMKSLFLLGLCGANVHYCETTDELISAVLEFLLAGDVLMVKASNTEGFSRIIEKILHRFPPVNHSLQQKLH